MDLLQYIRLQLDDEVTPYNWSDELLLEYIKDAVIEACVRANYTSAYADVSVSASEGTFTLPVGTQKIASASLRRTGHPDLTLKLTTVYDLDNLDPDWRNRAAGVPEYLNLDTAYGSAQLVPPPAEAATVLLQGQFIADFDAEALDLESRDTWQTQTPVPISHFKDLAYWVFYQAYDRRDEDSYAPEKALRNLELFEKRFGRKPDAAVVEYIRRGKPVRIRGHYL